MKTMTSRSWRRRRWPVAAALLAGAMTIAADECPPNPTPVPEPTVTPSPTPPTPDSVVMAEVKGAKLVDTYDGATGPDTPYIRLFLKPNGKVTWKPAAEVTVWRGSPFVIFNDSEEHVGVELPGYPVGRVFAHRLVITIPPKMYLLLEVVEEPAPADDQPLFNFGPEGGGPVPIIKDPPTGGAGGSGSDS